MATKSISMTATRWRLSLLGFLLSAVLVAIIWRLVDLSIVKPEFYQYYSDKRWQPSRVVSAERGVITDRNGQPLAISTPVLTVGMYPSILNRHPEKWHELAQLLNLDYKKMASKIKSRSNKSATFVYLKRRIPPQQAAKIMALEIPGVDLESGYKRYYPAGEVATHVLGYTNVDDKGQEGVELAFDSHLTSIPGRRNVMLGVKQKVVRELAWHEGKQHKPGGDVELSIDMRLQSIAHYELKKAVTKYRARSGSLVLLDTTTNEILAMVNQPAANPNDRSHMDFGAFRNRAMTDLIEPGSTIKPFSVAAALESGQFDGKSVFNVSPGRIRVDGKLILDAANYGTLDLAGVIKKSSNVGITQIALALPETGIRDYLSRMGMGSDTGSGFPGERIGVLPNYQSWQPVQRATLAYGYGLSVTAVQLAQAYSIFASGGVKKPVSILKLARPPEGEQVMKPAVARQVISMMESVTHRGGTGTRAKVPGYRVAGKTGTAHKVGRNGYEDSHYIAVFAGLAPVTNPKLVAVVVINDPSTEQYHGGQVAAPVFSKVMAAALRLKSIAPDQSVIPDLSSGAWVAGRQ
ncbi:MAG: penicillin-binding protein 2 [Pseudomonadales bacterium]|nr:penicillin-binding protein 2 [Pseudomonadales bacterium]